MGPMGENIGFWGGPIGDYIGFRGDPRGLYRVLGGYTTNLVQGSCQEDGDQEFSVFVAEWITFTLFS